MHGSRAPDESKAPALDKPPDVVDVDAEANSGSNTTPIPVSSTPFAPAVIENAVHMSMTSVVGGVTATATAKEEEAERSHPNDSLFAVRLSRGDLALVSATLLIMLALSILHLYRRHAWQPAEIEVLHPATDYQFTIDINSATWVEWLQLDGIGETLARRIVEHRDQHGPFRSIDDLNEVHGIGPAKLEQMRPHLRCLPPSIAEP